MPRQKNGSKPLENVAQIPFELIEAATTLKAQFKFVDGDDREWLTSAYNNIHRCLMFIAGGDCDLSELQSLLERNREARNDATIADR